jgi:hypothetical protein
MDLVPLNANRMLEMASELVVGWLLLEGASVAHRKSGALAADHPDREFYSGKVASAQYFARNVLPGVAFKAELLAHGDESAIDIPDDGF